MEIGDALDALVLQTQQIEGPEEDAEEGHTRDQRGHELAEGDALILQGLAGVGIRGGEIVPDRHVGGGCYAVAGCMGG